MTEFNILPFYSDFHISDLFFYYFRTVSKDINMTLLCVKITAGL